MEDNILKLKKEIKRLKNAIKKQRYGLVWMDVPEAFENDVENKLPILKEVPSLAIKNNDKKPTHVLIEGDNYHALTCLNYTHKNKIDIIYIDPPYNTGNIGSDGFRYKDKRIISKYPDGTPVPKEHPFRHSYWLSFMRKRLELAQSALKDEGIIFISIDNNEVAQLKLLCNEIFGENNYVGTLIWRKKEGGGQADAYFVTEHEYIIAYAKSKKFSWRDELIEDDESIYNKEDGNGKYTAVKLAKWGNTARREDRPKMYFPLIAPDGTKIYPIAPDGGNGRWRVGKKTMDMLLKRELVEWKKRDKRWIAYEKIYYIKEKLRKIKERSILYDLATTADGTNELTQIFKKKDVFENPKPIALIMFLLRYGADKDAIVLDFFAGSGTTGHAVMKLNDSDKGNRQFILITNNENDIMKEVCYPRLKKVIKGTQKISALGNSLKYYKTSFIGKNNVLDATDSDKVELAHNAGELLAITENTLELVKQNKYYQLFENGNKDKYTAVYFREELDQFEKFVKLVEKLSKKTAVYVFSWGDDEFTEEFEHIKDVKVKTIPIPIVEIYKKIYNLV